MKKWLAAMLILMLLVQALPLSALAAAAVGAPLSEAELKAAYALTGKYNGAGVYHNGMGVSESMNARQLIDWLEEQLNGDLAAAADQLASAQVALEDARTDNPEAYKQLTGMSGFDDLTGRIVELAAELEDARQTLRFHRDRLQEQTVMVEEMGELLEAEGLYDFEVARCNARIRTAAAGIADIRQDILDNSETWTADIALWKSIVNGTYRGASDLDARVNGCIAAIYDTAPEPASVRSNVVVCGRDTRAGRLKGAGSVLANDGSVITVMDDKHVYLEFHDPDGKPLEGLKVSARDYVDPKESKTAPKPVEGTTGPTGYVAFEISKFTADKKTKAFTLHIEVDARDVEVNGTHYQSLCLPMEKVSRGVKHTTTLKVDDLKTPYVYEATFHGYDIMYSQRQILYSSLNDEDFEIAVKVAGVEAEPTLYYAEDDKGTNEKSAKGTKNEDGVWIFKDKWKQILRPDKAAKIYFRFEGKDEKVATKLKPIWSVMDSPTNLASVLKGINPGFGLSFKLPPIAEGLDKSSIGFSIGGLDNFMPQFCVDVWGTVYLSIGGIKNTWDGIKDKWKTNELEDWENLEIEYDSDSKIERFKTELGARYDYLKSRKYEGMAKGGWRIGLYGILTAKWNKDTDDSDRSNFSLTGSGGIAIAYFVDFTFMFTIPPGAGVPLYLCLTVEGGLTMGIELGFDWYLKWNGKIWAVEDWNFTFHDFTVTFALGLSITFGVGIKGMVSGWIKGSGSISFVLNVFRERPVAFNIDASASFSIGVSFLLFTVSATLVSKTWHLYPEDNAAYPLMAHYMNKIPANDGEEEQVHTLTMPQHYPELAPEATLLLAEQEEASGGVKVATLGNALYAFFLQEDKIHWVNVSSPDGVEGDLSDAIQEGQALYGGEYDVDGMTDYAFDVCPGQGTVQVPRHDLNCDDYLAVTGLCAGVYDDMGVPLPEAGNICVYTVFLWQDADTGALVGSMNGDEHQLGCFHAAWAGTDEDPVPYIPSEPVLQQAFYTAQYGERDGSTGWFQDNVGADVELARAWDEDTGDAHTFTRIRLTHSAYCPADLSETYAADKSRYSLGKVSDAVRPDEGIESGAGGDYARVFSRGLQDGSWFAVSRSKGGEGDDGAVEYYDPVMDAAGEGNWRSVVLDKGGISAFASAPLTLSDGSQAAMLFYTDNAGNEEDGNLYRLKGLYVHPKDKKASSGDMDLETTLTTYDITLPTASFKLITIRSVIYLYWLESGSQDEAQEKDTYRLYTSIYDPTTNTMSGAQVLAEFAMPDDMAITEVFLTENGSGYLTALQIPDDISEGETSEEKTPVSMYGFTTNLKPVLSLEGQVIEDLLVAPGDYDDITVTVMNSGNMAAATLDIDVVLHDGKKDSVVATLHADCLDGKNSYLEMDGKKIVTGKKAFYRLEDYDYTPRQNDWLLEETDTDYAVKGGLLKETDPGEPQQQFVKTDAILPGAHAAFKGAFQIPTDWKGDKNIELVLKSYSSYLNWVGAMAQAEGRVNRAAANSAGYGIAANDMSTQLTWVRDDDSGEMLLVTQGLQTPAREMVARRAGAPDNVRVTALHDLVVDDRLTEGAKGEPMLAISVLDRAHTGERIPLSMQVYVDDAETPLNVSLSHWPEVVSDDRTHTFQIPLAAIVDPQTARKVRVVITGVGLDEVALANNEFTLYLDGAASPLAFLRQPRDVTVQEGESASFTVKVTGGTWPYSYQWQVYNLKTKKWTDIPGATEATLSREAVEKKWDGARFRCVVTDKAGESITSEAATLTVRESVPTGDKTDLPAYLAVALIALVLLWLLRRRAEKGAHSR